MAQTFQTSIRLKLTALVAAVVIVTALGLSVVSYVFARRTLRHQIHERLSAVASSRQRSVLDYIELQEERVRLVASRTRLRSLLDELATPQADTQRIRDDLKRILLDASRGSAGIRAILLTDLAGKVLAATDDDYLTKSYADTPELTGGLEDLYLDLTLDPTGHNSAMVAGPVAESNRTVAVVMMLVDAEPLARQLTDRTGLGNTGQVLLGRRDGETVQFLLLREAGTTTIEVPASRSPTMAAAAEGEIGFTETIDRRGSPVLAAYRPIGYQNWGIVTKISQAEAYAPINWLRNLFILVEGSIFVLGLVASYWLATRFTKPILRMVKMAESIAAGGLHAQVIVESNDEVGKLGRAFNRMSEDLAHSYALLEERVQQRTAELHAERDLLQQLMDQSPDNIYFKDRESRFLRVNRAKASKDGFVNPAAMIGKTDFDIFSEEHARQAYADEQRIISTGQAILGLEEKETWPDGHVTWVSSTKVPMRDVTGQVVGTFGISRDITDRKRAEQELNSYFDLSPDLFCIADFNGHFRRLSPSWSVVLGYGKDEMLPHPFISFVHPEDRNTTVATYQDLMRGTKTVQFENRYRCKDGSYRWLQWNAVPVLDQRIIHAVARDVSEHKRAQELLARFADALNKKNLEMQEDLKLAREVHQIFVPQNYPSFPRTVGGKSALRFAHRYLPTTALGGDFFEILRVSDIEAGVLICDVMGHGMRAALVTSIIRGLMDKYRDYAGDPGQFLTQINRALLANLKTVSATIFATMSYSVIDVTTGRVHTANAGHPEPLLVRPSAKLVQRLDGTRQSHSPPLGLMADTSYETTTQVLQGNESLLLFTDGLYEVEAGDGRQYGIGRLEETVRKRINTRGVQLLDELLLDTRNFSASGEFADDVCMVSVELTDPPAG